MRVFLLTQWVQDFIQCVILSAELSSNGYEKYKIGIWLYRSWAHKPLTDFTGKWCISNSSRIRPKDKISWNILVWWGFTVMLASHILSLLFVLCDPLSYTVLLLLPDWMSSNMWRAFKMPTWTLSVATLLLIIIGMSTWNTDIWHFFSLQTFLWTKPLFHKC